MMYHKKWIFQTVNFIAFEHFKHIFSVKSAKKIWALGLKKYIFNELYL